MLQDHHSNLMRRAPALARLYETLRADYPTFLAAVKATAEHEPDDFVELGGAAMGWAESALGTDACQMIARGYGYFVTDVNRQHIEYCLRGRYKNKTYKEVYDSVYDNDSYMTFYHWGVFATLFLWRHHLRLYAFYRDSFLPLVAEKASLVEMGSGSGIWTAITARARPDCRLSALDISKSSLDIATRVAAAAEVGDRVSFTVADALTYESETPFDAGLSCFLLEHLEQPENLVANLARNVKSGAPVFLTAAITAAEVDHIYEFRNEGEVFRLIEAAGFRILEAKSAAPAPDPRFKFLPRSLGVIAVKKTTEHW